jgi:spore maturation protein B
VSGSGSLGLLTDLVNTFNPDSMVGRTASVMAGSTETTFYTLTVYFGSVGIRNSRHALPAALSADIVCVISSVMVCHMLFA